MSAFETDKYLNEQEKCLMERVNKYSKLYLEFGGKLLRDNHASRVLPGYDPKCKISLLENMKDKIEIIICISQQYILKQKYNSDTNFTYQENVLQMIDELKQKDILVNSVVITRITKPNAEQIYMFIKSVESKGIKVYKHYEIINYVVDIDKTVSEEGYGKNDYIKTNKSLIVVTAPGPSCGKLSTCLSQLYNETLKNNKAGYAKFETFPVHNLPLDHPVNVAYQAATLDIKDVNAIDYFHLLKYNIHAVNYNRDIEAFPLLKKLLEKITGKESIYQSPTDMGVNKITCGIINDKECCIAAKEEIIRRYIKVKHDFNMYGTDEEALLQGKLLMIKMDLNETDLEVVKKTRNAAFEFNQNVVGVELNHGTNKSVFLSATKTTHLSAASNALMKMFKYFNNIEEDAHLMIDSILSNFMELNGRISRNRNLNCKEVLYALVLSSENSSYKQSIKGLDFIKGVHIHSTVKMDINDEKLFKRLGAIVTFD